jgi:histidinol-phosphate aminotransferase
MSEAYNNIKRGQIMDVNKLVNTGVSQIKQYVFGKPKEDIERKYNITDTVKMNSNENPLGVPASAVEQAERMLPRSNVYPEASNRILREKIAQIFEVKPENVFLGSGADEVIYYLAMGFLNDNDEIVIPAVTFPIYEIAAKIMRAKIVTSEMDGFGISLGDMLNKISERTKMLAVCNPNNPTGLALDKDDIYRFIDSVPSEVLIIMDEAYMEFADQDRFPDSIAKFKEGRENLFIIKTLSKAYGLAGFRVGYGVGDERIIEILNRIKLPFNISVVSQYAAFGALDDKAFLINTVQNTIAEREALYGALENMGLSYLKSSTNFILIDAKHDCEAVTEALMKRGVIVRSAKNYGAPTSIRVTIGTKDQNIRFVNSLKEVLKELDGT